MRVVMIVPTGIGCPIGGHAGDANPVAQLLGAACDELIVHPNVVNASDINEMPGNALYVDGHALDLFLEGELALRRVRTNRLLVAVNKPVSVETHNAVGAARATLGVEVKILQLNTPLRMWAEIDPEHGMATGHHEGVGELVNQVRTWSGDFDALAISSAIDVDRDLAERYLRDGRGVNPWGGIEAMVSRLVSDELRIPVAHAPIDGVIQDWEEVVDDRLAAECVSVAYLHCVLKGLRRAPRLVPRTAAPGSLLRPALRRDDLTVQDVDLLVSPAYCWGRPHEACAAAGIEVVWVAENEPAVIPSGDVAFGPHTDVANYLEAAGLVAARQAGVSVASVTRRDHGQPATQ